MTKNLLLLDCSAALFVGLVVVVFSLPLSSLEGLPRGILLFTGIVNLLYGAYSLSLYRRSARPMYLIKILAIGNMAWTPVCFSLAIIFATTASVFGFVHLIGEGLVVGVLGVLEWRNRELLLSR